MTVKPDGCCAAGCGRPTQSHNIAVDVSEHDAAGLPALAGVVCHRCWTERIGSLVESEPGAAEMLEALDTDEMVAVPMDVKEMFGP